MAEGDSVLRIARRMRAALEGRELRVTTPGRRRPEGRPASSLDGHVLERVESHGKHLLLHFDGGLTLHNHLGMSGGWQLYREGERRRWPAASAWIVLAAEGTEAVNFGGSTLRIGRAARLRRDTRLARLGPDIVAEGFDPAVAIARIRSADPRMEVGEALLDQSLVAGIGNIFKSEACFRARLDPWRRLESVSDPELAASLAAARELMLAAVETGRMPNRVYRRAGGRCPRCRGQVSARRQGEEARTTYWCPSCQAVERAPRLSTASSASTTSGSK